MEAIIKFEIEDNFGDTWKWDGERVYLESAEAELGSDENGFHASTFEEAIVALFENAAVGQNCLFITKDGEERGIGL